MTTALRHLAAAAAVIAQRGTDYDRPDGERSMGAAVAAWSAITGRTLSEADGWLLMALVKMVRAQTATDPADSLLDLTAYTALMAEAWTGADETCRQSTGNGVYMRESEPTGTSDQKTEVAHHAASEGDCWAWARKGQPVRVRVLPDGTWHTARWNGGAWCAAQGSSDSVMGRVWFESQVSEVVPWDGAPPVPVSWLMDEQEAAE